MKSLAYQEERWPNEILSKSFKIADPFNSEIFTDVDLLSADWENQKVKIAEVQINVTATQVNN